MDCARSRFSRRGLPRRAALSSRRLPRRRRLLRHLGVLIIGQIVAGLGKGFSFSEFWGRRAVRILPPYLLVVLACVSVAPFILVLPEQHADFGRQVTYSAVMLVNHYFLNQAGLFRRRGRCQAVPAPVVAGGRGAVLSRRADRSVRAVVADRRMAAGRARPRGGRGSGAVGAGVVGAVRALHGCGQQPSRSTSCRSEPGSSSRGQHWLCPSVARGCRKRRTRR